MNRSRPANLVSGADTLSGICIYTIDSVKSFREFLPLLVDRLGRVSDEGGNRLILSRPLRDGASAPSPQPQLPHDGLPLTDWANRYPRPNKSEDTESAKLLRDGNDAITD
jgi:hypothetical protein